MNLKNASLCWCWSEVKFSYPILHVHSQSESSVDSSPEANRRLSTQEVSLLEFTGFCNHVQTRDGTVLKFLDAKNISDKCHVITT